MQPQASPISYSPISDPSQLQQMSSMAQPPVAAPAPHESFLTRLLPTLGGVGGTILGGLLAPETGGLSLLAGGAIGSGLGQALGKGAENAFTGEGLGNGVLSNLASGAASGAMGAGLGGLTKTAGGLLSKFGTSASDRALQEAMATAGQTAQSAADKLALEKAAAFKNNYGVLNNKLQRQWNLGTNADFVDKVGLNGADPYHMQQVAGAGLDLNDVVDRALQAAPDVEMKGFGNQVFKGMQAAGTTDPNMTPLGRAFSKAKIPVINESGTIPDTLPATSVRQLMQSVGDEIGNSQRVIQNSLDNGLNPAQEQTNLDMLQGVYRDLRSKLSTNDSVNSAIRGTTVSPEEQAAFSEKYGKPLADHITNVINGSQSYDDIVPEMQKFAQMGQTSKLAIDDIENGRGPRYEARVKAAAKQNTPNAMPIEAPNPTAGHLLDTAGHAIRGNKLGAAVSLFNAAKGVSPNVALKAGGLLSRISKFVPAAAVAAGSVGGMGASPAGDMQLTGNNTMNPTQTQDPLNQLISANMAQNILAPSTMGGTSGSFLSAMAPQMQRSQMAEAMLGNLSGAFGNAGGGQGFGGGLLSRISGMIPGTSANAYQRQAQATAAQLAQLLGISPDAAMAMLPQLMQSPDVAGQRMGGLQATSALSAL